MQEQPEFFTCDEAAARLRVHPQTLRRMAVRREIPCRKIGAQIRIPASFVLRDTDTDRPTMAMAMGEDIATEGGNNNVRH